MPLESKIGKPVRFRPPQDARRKGAKDRLGKIIDEVWADESKRATVAIGGERTCRTGVAKVKR
jgi:hypothetical protein